MGRRCSGPDGASARWPGVWASVRARLPGGRRCRVAGGRRASRPGRRLGEREGSRRPRGTAWAGFSPGRPSRTVFGRRGGRCRWWCGSFGNTSGWNTIRVTSGGSCGRLILQRYLNAESAEVAEINHKLFFHNNLSRRAWTMPGQAGESRGVGAGGETAQPSPQRPALSPGAPGSKGRRGGNECLITQRTEEPEIGER